MIVISTAEMRGFALTPPCVEKSNLVAELETTEKLAEGGR